MATWKDEPEDYNLNRAQLHEQNMRVLAAKEKETELEKLWEQEVEAERKAALKRELAVAEQARKDAEDEVTLELLARAYKGKPVPEDWDPETHPAFMQDPATQIEEGNAFAIGMDKLRQPDAPEEVAERAKQKGNHFLKRGPRYYKEAIKHYTEAIDAKSADAQQNAIYHSNRAAVQLLLKNYGKVVEDCNVAIKLHPAHIKAYFRAARAYAGLHKWTQCIEVCEAGLKVEADNKEILKELSAAQEKLAVKRQGAKKAEAEKAKQMLAESKVQRALHKALEERGLRMGECVYGGAVQGGQSTDAYIDADGAVHWPVLFLYDEFDQSDYFQDAHEEATVQGCLDMLFDEASPPPDWDPERRYRADNLAVYIATNQSKELRRQAKKEQSDEDFLSSILAGSERKGVEEEYQLAAKSRFVKVCCVCSCLLPSCSCGMHRVHPR